MKNFLRIIFFCDKGMEYGSGTELCRKTASETALDRYFSRKRAVSVSFSNKF